MEGQEGVPIPAKEQIIQKSPQELAAQVDAVFGTLVEFTRHPEGKAIDQRYKENRKFVETLLESGVSNEQLGEELGRLYEQGRDLGLYSPLRGERADEFLAYAKEYYRGWGIPEDEAEQRAKEALAKQGFAAEVRKWRHDYEKGINQHFVDAVERHPLSGEEEAEKIRQLRERVVYPSHPDQVRELAAQFPGGNYLYHGTKTEQAIGILESGALVNAKTLHEAEEARLAREGGGTSIH